MRTGCVCLYSNVCVRSSDVKLSHSRGQYSNPPPLTVTMVTPAPSTPPVCYHGNPRPFIIMLFLCCGRFCSSFTVRVETSTFIIKQPPEGKTHPESVLTPPTWTHTHTPVICEHAARSLQQDKPLILTVCERLTQRPDCWEWRCFFIPSLSFCRRHNSRG